MTYVRPHVRRDGTYVKGHNRRTRPRTAVPTAPRPRRAASPRPRSVQYGPTTYVRPHVRGDGTYVRGHRRSIAPRDVAVVAVSGTGILALVFLLLALLSGGGDDSKAPTGTSPSHSASAPAHQR